MNILGYLWLFLVIFGYPMVIFGYLWLSLVIFGYLWLFLVIFGCPMVIFGYLLLFLVIFFSVMDTPNHLPVCTCNLKLGVEQLSAHDVLNSEEQERKYKLVNQAIHFHGACDSTENCTIKKKIYEIKDRIAEYYFDPQKKVIAIPNQIIEQSTVLDKIETDKIRQRKIAIDNDKYYEDLLHLTIINILQNLDSDGFVMEGLHSGSCLQAKQLRKYSQCKCKSNLKCTCGKLKYPELNEHEKNMMDILEAREMTNNELARYRIVFIEVNI